MEIGALIRSAREAAGLSQRALAAAAGTSAGALSRYERGHVAPGADTLLRVLTATGHTLRLAPIQGDGVDEGTEQEIRVQLQRSVEARLENLIAMTDLRRRAGVA